jgi:hypothetical protein
LDLHPDALCGPSADRLPERVLIMTLPDDLQLVTAAIKYDI